MMKSYQLNPMGWLSKIFQVLTLFIKQAQQQNIGDNIEPILEMRGVLNIAQIIQQSSTAQTIILRDLVDALLFEDIAGIVSNSDIKLEENGQTLSIYQQA